MGNEMNRRDFLKVVGLGTVSQAIQGRILTAEHAKQKPISKNPIIRRTAKDTLTAVELDRGEILYFKLLNGQVRQVVLKDTSAKPLLKGNHGMLYHFECRLAVDGHEMVMERYVGSQESFYQPYVINGMRIWFDAVADIFDFVLETHGKCKPHKDARFAISDASVAICPEEVKPWCPLAQDFIDIKDCYNGDDCWMGAYAGVEAHGGLDINHPRGTEIYTPISVDDHYFYKSLVTGYGNNGWRGVRKWANDDVWKISVAHIVRTLYPEHKPLPAGTHIAQGAGIGVWEHEHSHFMFMVTGQDGQEIHLDPWIIFWQIFENNREKKKTIKAKIKPLGPQKTGKAVSFSSFGTRKSEMAEELKYYWNFGDGGFSTKPNPHYVYLKPGIYPVTLTVDDGIYLDSFTHHITVDGEVIKEPGLVLTAEDEITFRKRPVHIMDVYGIPPAFTSNTLNFTARPSRPMPDAKILELSNSGAANLQKANIRAINYEKGHGWLTVKQTGQNKRQQLIVTVNASGLKPATYRATVEIECSNANNDCQEFCVKLTVPDYQPPSVVTIDNGYIGFYATPYFWVGHRFHNWPCNGYNCFCQVNGKRAVPGEFVRYTPDLKAGRYIVFFPEIVSSWWKEEERSFTVRVKHKNGTDTVRMAPKQWRLIKKDQVAAFLMDYDPDQIKPRAGQPPLEPNPAMVIGTFEFDEGTDGFAEILAEGSKGQVSADAIIFKKIS